MVMWYCKLVRVNIILWQGSKKLLIAFDDKV
jgi:hypothetical protein